MKKLFTLFNKFLDLLIQQLSEIVVVDRFVLLVPVFISFEFPKIIKKIIIKIKSVFSCFLFTKNRAARCLGLNIWEASLIVV
jgi:hypothetical protein